MCCFCYPTLKDLKLPKTMFHCPRLTCLTPWYPYFLKNNNGFTITWKPWADTGKTFGRFMKPHVPLVSEWRSDNLSSLLLACISVREEVLRPHFNIITMASSSFYLYITIPGGTSDKDPVCQSRRHKRCGFDPWVGNIPWRRAWQPTPIFCLENPMDKGAWRATVHGITQS